MEGKGKQDTSGHVDQQTLQSLDQSGVQIDHLENIIVSLSSKI